MKSFNKRKWWHLKNNRDIHIEFSGWKCNPSIYFRVDADEREICFHIGMGFGLWVVFNGFFPYSWYPKSVDKRYKFSRTDRELSLSIHGGRIWWNIWKDDEYWNRKSWRKNNFDFVGTIKGKHKYEKFEEDRREFVLPFFEGNYNVEIIKYKRVDSYTRWPKRVMTTYEARFGYYENGEWKEKPVPVEGKGENSWDCDEDATYKISFPGYPYRKDIRTPYDAALYAWHSVMQSRERYGSAKWVPKGYNKKLEILKATN